MTVFVLNNQSENEYCILPCISRPFNNKNLSPKMALDLYQDQKLTLFPLGFYGVPGTWREGGGGEKEVFKSIDAIVIKLGG